MNKMNIPGNVDEYIAMYPENIRIMLEKIRAAIRQAAPEAQEKISYQMPSYKLKGMLVYFAAHTNHMGFYPLKSAIEAFKSELEQYQTSKGTVQFPYNKPLPVNLIKRIIKFRVRENLVKAASKLKK
jgi:uncharacterized protein YdhG (YjbR/CyaY superfamily)